MANPEHLELLRQGVDVWNAWRIKECWPSLLLETDLSEANLQKAALQKADLDGVNLYDELPAISVSRMRASGAIGPDTKTTTIAFGDVEFVVGLTQRHFPNGGGWSFFVCPCGRRARILRLYEGGLACCRCLLARGLRARVELVRMEKRAVYLAPKRLERLNSDTPARINPRPGRMLDRRANMELALKRSLIVERRAKIAQFEKDAGET